jgi:hypothetical protein
MASPKNSYTLILQLFIYVSEVIERLSGSNLKRISLRAGGK